MKEDTKIVATGRKIEDDMQIVNPPVYHASTVLLPNAQALRTHDRKFDYARRGSPSTFAFQEALAALEGGHNGVLTPSGMAAVTTAILSFVSAGDHILVVDNCYAPTRKFCDIALQRLGVETTFYDPTIGARIETLFKENTKLIFCESPGSQTFEVQDLPAISKVAHDNGIMVMTDNTWASPYFLKPFALGVDISVQSITKYVSGHSDLLMGAITSTEAHWSRLQLMHRVLGVSVGPDDVYLAQRGFRTLGIRMRQHHENGLTVARWLAERPEVERVMHPALETHPQYEIWKRDFSGASGTFGVVLKQAPGDAIDQMINGYEYFGIGYSFGGYESLAITTNPSSSRSATDWDSSKTTMRYHIGLEDPEDLIADLAAGFDRLAKG